MTELRHLTRTQFVGAVERAISATPSLTVSEAERLRIVARGATEFGSNFSGAVGCPAVLAGIYRPRSERSEAGQGSYDDPASVLFAFAFDDEIKELGYSYPWDAVPVRVVEG